MNLTVEDVTRLFNVSEKTIHRWVKSSNLPACLVNSQYRFNRTDLLDWASAHQVSVAPGMVEGESSARSLTAGVAEALSAGGIHHRVRGRDKAAVLAAVVDLLHVSEQIDRELLLGVLLAREEMGSTAIGEGIAIPHARNPIVLNVQRPLITLCFLDQPIEFGASDGQPVNTLFTLISPTVPLHLRLLSRLMFVLRDPSFKPLLLNQAPREQLLQAIREAEAALNQTVLAGA